MNGGQIVSLTGRTILKKKKNSINLFSKPPPCYLSFIKFYLSKYLHFHNKNKNGQLYSCKTFVILNKYICWNCLPNETPMISPGSKLLLQNLGHTKACEVFICVYGDKTLYWSSICFNGLHWISFPRHCWRIFLVDTDAMNIFIFSMPGWWNATKDQQYI